MTTPQSKGGARRAEMLTAAERTEIARSGARALHSPAGLAQRLVKAWPELDATQQAEVLLILDDGGVVSLP